MPFTVQDLLELPVMQAGTPEVVHGHELGEREIRWVHTSEIYEISPLLKGGEVLLTTGLGLVGVGDEAIRRYICGLASRHLACLVLELGRTFTTPPAALVEETRNVDLPLVVLHSMVPFIEITEAAHALLLNNELQMLRLTERISTGLNDAILDGGGLPSLIERVAELAGCPASLQGADGHLVVSSDGTRRGGGEGDVLTPVELFGDRWGTLVLHGSRTPLRSVVAPRAARAVSLELIRSDPTATARRQAGAHLLRDMVERRYASTTELTTRAAAIGIARTPGRRLLACCLTLERVRWDRQAAPAVREAIRKAFLSAASADLGDGSYLIAAVAARTELHGLLDRLADTIDQELRTAAGGRVANISAAPLVDSVPELAVALVAARETSLLAHQLGTQARIVLTSELSAHRLLAPLAADSSLEAFVEEQLGALLDHDAQHGTRLVHTLDVYLEHGQSKAATAQALGIRRQTLYNRLARICRLLDVASLESREVRTAIDLGLIAWRLRRAAVVSPTRHRETAHLTAIPVATETPVT